ncbi:hypothetical protein EQW78_01630 [Oerskovia turbata]|uniref:DUF3892 domain-containing protein n=1 Tax=Oerskovia turbata TaxID=1713 RepID=A0A4V1N5Q8_9CELL|nr:hypothetical protein [Oerskovia turbata]RXR26363.1 hypothetical protein EQW73_08570 [Oerskovia turbata]RXR36538.1 hypothetical protein EQW78_01630 [Oerskovia turbata]TGJ97551.1 hypothetical protein DLJ96_06265 [Actinotalea fermentans ATCC 43279 = JCM 9966 = DSM 3133]
MPFIRAIRTMQLDPDSEDEHPSGEPVEHLVAVLHSVTTTGTTTATSVVGVHRRIMAGERFRTFDERNHHQADVVARTDHHGHRALSTTVDGRTSDHLWRLPRF